MEINHDTRVAILTLHAIAGYTFDQIATVLPGVNAQAAQRLLHRAKTRANSNNFTQILDHIDPLPRSGAPRRVEPGSRTSLRIRQDIRDKWKWQSQPQAANYSMDSVRDISIRKPLQELGTQQVHNILRGKAHCQADPVDKRPIHRKRALNKIALEKLDLDDRKRYIEQVLALKAEEVELIFCDETPLDFGGCGGKNHVSALKGVDIYSDQFDPRFSRM